MAEPPCELLSPAAPRPNVRQWYAGVGVTWAAAPQSFKLAGYALWPFGRMVVYRQDRDVALGCLGNVLWFVFGGFWLALGHLITGILLCLTIIGIPFGVASFKMAGLALAPFGKEVIPRDQLMPGAQVIIGDFSR